MSINEPATYLSSNPKSSNPQSAQDSNSKVLRSVTYQPQIFTVEEAFRYFTLGKVNVSNTKFYLGTKRLALKHTGLLTKSKVQNGTLQLSMDILYY